MQNYFSKYDDRVRQCRHCVTAWFGEAEPKILWRVGKEEAAGTFWLRRHGNGWTEIVKRDRGGAETTIASFSRAETAEHALEKLKGAMLGTRHGLWQILLWLLAAFGLFVIFANFYDYIEMRKQTAALSQYQQQAPVLPSQLMGQQMPTGLAPAQSVAPASGPVAGAPVDADSVLH